MHGDHIMHKACSRLAAAQRSVAQCSEGRAVGGSRGNIRQRDRRGKLHSLVARRCAHRVTHVATQAKQEKKNVEVEAVARIVPLGRALRPQHVASQPIEGQRHKVRHSTSVGDCRHSRRPSRRGRCKAEAAGDVGGGLRHATGAALAACGVVDNAGAAGTAAAGC